MRYASRLPFCLLTCIAGAGHHARYGLRCLRSHQTVGAFALACCCSRPNVKTVLFEDIYWDAGIVRRRISAINPPGRFK